MSDEIWKAYAHGMAAAMNNGGIHVPSQLLLSYRQLGLSESEFMLLIQMKQYAESEHKDRKSVV